MDHLRGAAAIIALSSQTHSLHYIIDIMIILLLFTFYIIILSKHNDKYFTQLLLEQQVYWYIRSL